MHPADLDPSHGHDGEFLDLLEALPDALLVVDRSGVIRYVNERALAMFGYARGDLVGQPLGLLVPDGARTAHDMHRQEFFAHPAHRPMGSELAPSARRSDGTEIAVDISLSTLRHGGDTLTIATVRDLPSSTGSRDRQRMVTILDHANDAVVGESLDGIITSWNHAAELLYGYSADEAIGRPTSILEPRRRHDDLTLYERLTRGESIEQWETSQVDKDGRRLDVSVSASLTRDPAGRVTGTATVAKDLTGRSPADLSIRELNADLEVRVSELLEVNKELTRAQRDLAHHALHDPLTGLPNRRLFLRRVADALRDADRTGLPLAVYFIDLDGFKRVNDVHGHAAGDDVLRAVTTRLRAAVRAQDTVARLSGDELVVLTPGATGARPAAAMADRLLRALHVPPLRSGHETVTASVGMAVSQPGDDAEGLLSDADAAMYRAKRHGGARWVLYGSDMREEQHNRSVSEAQLRDALANDGLRVLYQPIVDLRDGHTIGAEALVRLRSAEGRLLSPDDFIQTAEETGLVIPLGQRVLNHACRQPVRWVCPATPEPFVSVNVSPRQLEESHMATAVESALTASGLSGDRLRLEVTESALLDIGPAVRDTLNELRTMGVQIGVDDFGTGYASMAYVRNLPLDFVKIDRSYVAGMETDSRDRAMVEATLTLSHSLGLRSVAEGIETQAHWDILRDLGCSEGQGYLFSRPLRSSMVRASRRKS